jgi:hypothetical protein
MGGAEVVADEAGRRRRWWDTKLVGDEVGRKPSEMTTPREAGHRRTTGRLTPLLLAAAALAAATMVVPADARAATPVTVPVDVGIGPAAYIITGRVADDQPIHLGLKLSVQAIIDQATIQRHQNRIPPRLRARALRMKEVRISPSILIPDALIISPAARNTGIYGVTWRPIGANIPLIDGEAVTLRLQAALLATYAYLTSSLPTIPTTHFLRPGLDLGAELEMFPSPLFGISVGWSSGLYLPQALGSFALKPDSTLSATEARRATLWHFGQAFLKIHVRFPHTTRL